MLSGSVRGLWWWWAAACPSSRHHVLGVPVPRRAVVPSPQPCRGWPETDGGQRGTAAPSSRSFCTGTRVSPHSEAFEGFPVRRWMGKRRESMVGRERRKHLFSAVDLAAEQDWREINSDGSWSISPTIPSRRLPDLASSPSAQIQPLPQPVPIPRSGITHEQLQPPGLGQRPDVLILPAVHPEDVGGPCGLREGLFRLLFHFFSARLCVRPYDTLKENSLPCQFHHFRRAAIARCERRRRVLSQLCWSPLSLPAVICSSRCLGGE